MTLICVQVCAIHAEEFTVDTNLSHVTISGTVVGGTVAEQAPGSLTASLAGFVQIAINGGGIQFPGGSTILAKTNGTWQPLADGTAGTEPADFGGKANLGVANGVAALRDVQLDVVSPAIQIQADRFDSSSLIFFFPSNAVSSMAYNVTGLINKHGFAPLTGYATNKVTALASLTTSGSQQVLTIPVDATFILSLVSANDTVIRLSGQLVANRTKQALFQVESVALQNQSILLQWQAANGQPVQVQSSTDLNSWQTNATITTPPSGMYTWTSAVSGPVGFFRLAK